ncbi:uncharacterized protein LOC120348260 [Styela clava]
MDIHIRICFIIVLCLGFSQSCYIEIKNEGDLDFSSMIETAAPVPLTRWFGEVKKERCAIAKRLNPRLTTELEFKEMNLFDEEIQVYVNKRFYWKSWELMRSFNSSFGNNTKLVFNGYRAVKIVGSKKDQFKLNYKSSYCPVPESVKVDSCTKKRNRGSTCSFKCNDPEYVSLNKDKKAFRVKCRRNFTWTLDSSHKCISLAKVIDLCLSKYSTEEECPFGIDHLVTLFPEPEITDNSPIGLVEFLAGATREMHKDIDWKLDSSISARAYRPGDDCYKFCLRSKATSVYMTSCGNPDLSAADKGKCVKCRHIKKICDRRSVFA